MESVVPVNGSCVAPAQTPFEARGRGPATDHLAARQCDL